MSEPILPDGARSNGLVALDWIVVAATTPPIADNLLVALRQSGIAAFSLPQVDESVYRGLSLTSPLNHRVFVDRSKREIAAALVAKEQSEMAAMSGGTEFEQIVSRLSMPSASNYLDDLDREDHFEPAAPEPLPKFSRPTRLALIGVLGGPALMTLIALTNIDPTGFGTWLGLFGFVAGFVTLLWRAKDSDEPLPPDGGAVV
jgi:hypothetical protein